MISVHICQLFLLKLLIEKFTLQAEGFVNHVNTSRPDTTYLNPWFTQAYQQDVNCMVRGSFTYSSSTVCVNQSYGNNNFEVEVYARDAIKALYAFSYGFKEFAKAVCGENRNLSCRDTYSRTEAFARKLKNIIGNITIPSSDTSNEEKLQPFDPNSDGSGGYIVRSQQYIKDSELDYLSVYEFRRQTGDRADLIRDLSEGKGGASVKFYQLSGVEDNQAQLNAGNCDPKVCENKCGLKGPEMPDETAISLTVAMGVVVPLLVILVVILAVKAWRGKKFRLDGKSITGHISITIQTFYAMGVKLFKP